MLSRVCRRSFMTMSRTMRAEGGAASTSLSFQLATPTETVYNDQAVYRVGISTKSGDMAVMANFIPTIAELRPGVVAVEESEGSKDVKKWFVPGGFCLVQADSRASVTCPDAIPLDELCPTTVDTLLAEAEGASKTGEPEDKAKAEIAVEVYKAMQHALK